jgi:hypothetical protein
MSSTLQRDQVFELAKTAPQQALLKARRIPEPWFRAQALACVARCTEGDPLAIASEAAQAAADADDGYKRSAVRAWEIAALGERRHQIEARRALRNTVNSASTVQSTSSRSEALIQLLQAACAISQRDADELAKRLYATCPTTEHWRCITSFRLLLLKQNFDRIRNGAVARRMLNAGSFPPSLPCALI